MHRDQIPDASATAAAPIESPLERQLVVAYLVNQYPKVSHSFIRREIAELERQGIGVQRIALRGWDAALADAHDVAEREHTAYVVRAGFAALALATVKSALRHRTRWLRTLFTAARLGWRADRPWPVHLFYFAEACQVAQWLRRAGAGHVHAHFGTNSAEVAMLAAMLAQLPFSLTVHGPEEFDKPASLHLPAKLAAASFVVAISSFCRSQLWRHLPHAQWHKVREVRCALEHAAFAATPPPPPAAPRLVCVGRLCEQKGQLLLLEAVHRLARQGRRVELVLAGDGEMRCELEQMIAQCELGRQVRITGWISSAEVRAELLAARALVLPSFAEGLPVVIMEAMALGRPVLCTQIAGIPELVIPKQNGWLFAAGDIDALCQAMVHCLDAPLELLERMGRRGRRRVLARHAIESEVGKLAACFRAAQLDRP
jgi:colanic acid/amylovoran biosynthesis glycosyltransferase